MSDKKPLLAVGEYENGDLGVKACSGLILCKNKKKVKN
jgi:hypothetical protein